MSTQAFLDFLANNPGVSDDQIAAAANAYGLNASTVAAVTGLNTSDVESRFANAVPSSSTQAIMNDWASGKAAIAGMGGGMMGWSDVYKNATNPNASPGGGMEQAGNPNVGLFTPPSAQTGLSDDQIRQFLQSNPNIPDKTIVALMDKYGVSVSQMARATGMNISDIQPRFDAVKKTGTGGTPTQTPNQQPTNPDVRYGPGTQNTQSSGDYQNQMNQYYKAYFGGGAPDQGLLSSWYGTDYVPRNTGYQKAATQAAPVASTNPTEFNYTPGDGPQYDPNKNVIIGGSR